MSENHERLASFCTAMEARQLWQPCSQLGASVCEASLSVDFLSGDDAIRNYQVLAQRYQTIGHEALKVNLWENADARNYYLGAVGYHQLTAEPYFKLTALGYSEQQMYAIIEAVDNPSTVARH